MERHDQCRRFVLHGNDCGDYQYNMEASSGPTCTGGWVDTNNFCWIKSASAASCVTACASLGGCNVNPILFYTGAGGSDANCQTVMNGLAMAGSGAPSTIALAVGCAASGTTRRRGTTQTTCSATSAGYIRACSCLDTGSACYHGGGGGVVQNGACITSYGAQFVDGDCGESCTDIQGTSCCTDGVIDANPTTCTEIFNGICN